MAEIIKSERRRICDFCGKGQEAVKYLIVSPEGTADICEGCIAECAGIIEQREAAKKEAESTGNAGVSG